MANLSPEGVIRGDILRFCCEPEYGLIEALAPPDTLRRTAHCPEIDGVDDPASHDHWQSVVLERTLRPLPG